jgi:glycosyltransferase 2 family protein
VTDAPGRAGRSGLARTALGWLLGLALLAGFAVAVGGRWSDVGRDLAAIRAAVVAAAFGLCLVGVVLTYLAWRIVLADLGSRVPVAAGSRVFFVGQLGKYLPGSVWPVLVQMRMGAALGVPRSRTGFAFVVTFGMSLAWGLVVGLVAVPSLLGGQTPAYAWLLALLPAAAVFLHPRPLNALLGVALRLARRPPLEQPLSARGIALAGAALVGFWVVGGLHVWLLAVDLGAPAGQSLPVAVGGFALAFCAGPLVVFAPAGAGVREAVLVALLVAVLTTPAAVAVAVVSRLLLVLVDGVLAGAALLAERRTR